jgi:tRNA threonylcarbamoyladenosine biosynthesis protein TsaE
MSGTARSHTPDLMTLSIEHSSDLPAAAGELLGQNAKSRIFLFYGEMGSGKTTFIKAICQALGVTDMVSSPTFSIVNEYRSPSGPVYHFDFYRLKRENEALDLGYEDYLSSGNYCFIEWPEKISSLLPQDVIKIHMEITGDSQRRITTG